MTARKGRPTGNGAADDHAGDGIDTILREPPDEHPHKCEAAGIYCGALGLPELAAAGRARRCCRHYWRPSEGAA